MNNTMTQLLLEYLDWINPNSIYVISLVLFIFIYLGLSPFMVKSDMTFSQIIRVKLRHILLASFALCICVTPAITTIIAVKIFPDNGKLFIQSLVDEHATAYSKINNIIFLLASCGIAVLTKIGFYRIFVPQYNAWKRSLRVKQSGEELSDIRVEKDELKSGHFDPQKYYKDEYFFYGLDQNGKPIYDNESEWKEQNQKIIGPTRTGKGVHIGVQVDQAIRKNMNVFVIDPKPDHNLQNIMKQSCEENNRKFIMLDLNDNDNGYWQPFTGGKERDRRSRILYALGLTDTGNESDFYKTKERNIIDHIIKDNWDGTLTSLIEKMETQKDDIQRSYSIAKEWLEIKTMNANKTNSFSIADAIKQNYVVYIRSSLDDEIIRKSSTIFIMELIQELRRLHEAQQKPEHMFIAIDEVRFMVSNLLADALATCVGCRANFLLAYQSLLDIRNIGDVTVDVKGLEASLNVNCKTTLCYGASDIDTARWASDLSGTIQKSVTRMEKVEVQKFGTEVWDNERMLNRVEVPLINQNQILMLPSRTGILFRQAKLAEITYTCWVNIIDESDDTNNDETKLIEYLPTTDNTAIHSNENTQHTKTPKTKSIADIGNI